MIKISLYLVQSLSKLSLIGIANFFKIVSFEGLPKFWQKKWHPHGDSNPGCRDENPVS